MESKIEKNFFVFIANCDWIGCVKLPLLRREYFSSAVSVLKNSLKILSIINSLKALV